MSERTFDDLTDVYEAMIDWSKRLATETPLFRRAFEQAGVKRVADVACGTGRHAAMFHQWGLEVEGSDISPGMIAQARSTYGEPGGLRWTVRGFDQPPGAPGSVDAVVCVGNSLALAPDHQAAAEAVRQMLNATRPGGVVIVHVLNLWKLPDGPMLWQKIVRQPLPQGPSLILKGVHRSGDRGFVELVVVPDPPSQAPNRYHSNGFLGLRGQELETAARQAGAAEVRLLGGHAEQPYDPASSGDLIMIATRAR